MSAELLRPQDGAGADDGVGHFGRDAADRRQRRVGAQRHFDHADATGDERFGQRHGSVGVIDDDHGDQWAEGEDFLDLHSGISVIPSIFRQEAENAGAGVSRAHMRAEAGEQLAPKPGVMM